MRRMGSANATECVLCGALVTPFVTSEDYISGEEFTVYTCPSCGLGRTLPQKAPAELSQYYAKGYYKKRKSGADEYINRLRFKKVSRMAGTKKRILDVGCGNGALVETFSAAGWEAAGIEMAPPEHFVSNDAQKKIFIGDIREAPYPPKSFDVITLFHVLEHLSEPREYLAKIRELLTDGGLLVIEVPNLASVQARLTGGKWFNLDVPRHVFHFTTHALAKMLEQSGFRIEHTTHYSPVYSFFGFLQSLLNLVTRRSNILFDLLNGKISLRNYASQRIRFLDLFLTALFFAPALALALPLTIIESCAKRGGIIVFYARL